jgi:hypothetical protein
MVSANVSVIEYLPIVTGDATGQSVQWLGYGLGDPDFESL